MGRYLRLYASFLRFAGSQAMEFRFDFFFRIGMDLVWAAMHFAFFQVLFLHSGLFGGWTRPQMHIFLGAMFLSDALYMTLFANGMWWLPIRVNRGDLDYALVRPVSPLFMLSVREFAVNSLANLAASLAFTAWAIHQYAGAIPMANLLLFGATICVGVVLHFLLLLAMTVPVFWTQSGAGLRDVHFALNRYAHYPDAIFQGWLRRLLVSALPFALFASFPTRILFASDPWPWVLQVASVFLALAAIALGLWHRGLKSYSSASS